MRAPRKRQRELARGRVEYRRQRPSEHLRFGYGPRDLCAAWRYDRSLRHQNSALRTHSRLFRRFSTGSLRKISIADETSTRYMETFGFFQFVNVDYFACTAPQPLSPIVLWAVFRASLSVAVPKIP